ncbi:COP9 signalosome complex subunit 1 [Capsicum baccatum]|uniref:COP9 signalosome complex subunit 1 n=1 Tax=Capsicum baccatum TaxID=33114 RepID=A0A2G2WG04_CAPBA|nr:COP9 signalosome complex subunit 1 [Capsicum baccatum]
MCLNAILVSIEMGQFTHVTSYVSKAGKSQDDLDVVIVAKLRCAAGLANLEAKKHKLAARKVHSETTCISIAGLTILLWPVVGIESVIMAIFSSFFIGLYGAVIVYQSQPGLIIETEGIQYVRVPCDMK